MKPRLGLLLGDRNGIGPEIAAKLLARPETHENTVTVLIADPEIYRDGKLVADVEINHEFECHPLLAPANETDRGIATAAAGTE